MSTLVVYASIKSKLVVSKQVYNEGISRTAAYAASNASYAVSRTALAFSTIVCCAAKAVVSV